MDRNERAFEGTELGLGESPTVTPVSGVDGREVSSANLIGQVLDDKYQIVRFLGEGGMGAVYEARHTTIGSRAAVKVLHPEAARQPESLARFKREAQAAGTIGHPNIVRVLDIGQTPAGLPYMVMDFVEGQSLAELIRREAPLVPARAVAIVEQVLSALGTAHEKGIVHRDVKPDNVLISTERDGNEVARVLDFGISKFKELGPDRQGLTRTGTILGTPLYMAPEQARGETDVDHRIDLYAVGVTLYVMLTGQQPYRASNYNALLLKIVSEEPPSIDVVKPGLPPELVAVVAKAMARDRDARFGSATEFVDALKGRTRVEAVTLVPRKTMPVPPDRRRGLIPWIAAAALLLAGGGVAGVLALGPAARDEGAARGGPDLATSVPAVVPAVAPAADAGQRDSAAARDAGPGQAVDALVTLSIEAEPGDAQVRVDGALVGNPVQLQRRRDERGTVEIGASADGYQPETRVVSLATDIVVSISLERRRAKTASRPNPMRPKTGN